MTFLPNPKFLAQDQIESYISILTWKSWIPQFFVLHNTGSPNLQTYNAYPENIKHQWPQNLIAYYKGLGWHSGPHFVCVPDGVWVLCDPTQDGVQCSCWNKISIASEMVGDFEPGADDPNSGLGAKVINNAITLMGAIHRRFGWDPGRYELGKSGLHFHRECIRDHHACPGSLVNKANIVARVQTWMGEIVDIPPPTPEPQQTVDVAIPAWPPVNDPFFSLAKRAYDAWSKLTTHLPLVMAGLANAEAESTFNVKAVGDNGTAHGLYQWHGDRIKILLDEAKTDILTASLEDQIWAAYWELQHKYPKTLNKLLAASTAAEAAEIFCAEFEGAGAPNATQRRAKMSERWAVHFQNVPAGA